MWVSVTYRQLIQFQRTDLTEGLTYKDVGRVRGMTKGWMFKQKATWRHKGRKACRGRVPSQSGSLVRQSLCQNCSRHTGRAQGQGISLPHPQLSWSPPNAQSNWKPEPGSLEDTVSSTTRPRGEQIIDLEREKRKTISVIILLITQQGRWKGISHYWQLVGKKSISKA